MPTNFYLSKYAYCGPQLTSFPAADLGMIIVIPCFKEPNLNAALNALWSCERPQCTVEVIVVINQPANCDPQIAEQNNSSLNEAKQWIDKHADQKLNFHLIQAYDLPPKHSGVGLARKIGMDEAVHRFDLIMNQKGIIVCFDADSTCSANYLTEIEKHFENHPDTPGCSIHFEHPLSGTEFPIEVYNGIVYYELFLRYYNQGLRYAGFPYAFHTIGSSMAVRSDAYQKQGGMNKRKAGEDFYFLHKIIPLGNFSEITAAQVIPSPRPSDRVPFGTGKAVGKWMEQKEKKFFTYNFQSFIDLKYLFSIIESCYTSSWELTKASLPQSTARFMDEHKAESHLQEIKGNSSSMENFIKRFYTWFDGFMVLKYIHYSRDHFYPDIEITEACRELLHKQNVSFDESDALSLLAFFRDRERAKKEDPSLIQKRI